MEIKVCKKCGDTKPILDFSVRKSGGKSGQIRAKCKSCEAVAAKIYRMENPEKHCAAVKKWQKANPEVVKGHQRKIRYGITPQEFEILKLGQSGNCACCGVSLTASLHVDHCHVTGKIRGLLCSACNTGLGLFKDSTEILQRAIQYLQKNS